MTKVNKNDVNNTNTLPKTLNVLGLHGKMVPKKRSGVYNKFVALECGNKYIIIYHIINYSIYVFIYSCIYSSITI